jgi:spore coat polysaccharide biosynthesis protein SpsF
MGSTRLPNKVLLEVGGVPLLEYEIKRLRLAKKIDKIVVATTTNINDDKIFSLCQKINIDCFRGAEEDVLGRYYECWEKYQDYGIIIRVTGDCPLIDPTLVDETVDFFEKNNYDFASNVEEPTYPDGMDIEIFTAVALAEAAAKAKLASEREHIGQYFRNNVNFKKGSLKGERDFSRFRLTVDNKEDFAVVKFVIENSRLEASYLDYIALLEKNPDIMTKNFFLKRNKGLERSLKNDHLIK